MTNKNIKVRETHGVDTEQFPWEVRRNGTVCAHAASHQAAERIIKQLKKIAPKANFTAKFIGKPIRHCGEGGKPID